MADFGQQYYKPKDIITMLHHFYNRIYFARKNVNLMLHLKSRTNFTSKSVTRDA